MDSNGRVNPIIKQFREPGISFVIRARNEEAHLPKALDSLKDLVIPYEIILILHKCIDKSKEIAEERIQQGMPIQIHEWDYPISRAGYENLATPGDHPYSLQTFYNNAFALANLNWIFKWDADFEATSELVQFLNYKLDIENLNHIRYRLPCVLGNKVNSEYYLSNSLLLYIKSTFWEVPIWHSDTQSYDLVEQILSIPVDTIKTYWDETPWFLEESPLHDPEITKKWKFLNIICGPESKAGARASSNELQDIEYFIRQNQEYLKTHEIYLMK